MAKGARGWGPGGRQAVLCSRVPTRLPLEIKQDRGLRGLQWGSGVTLRASRMCGGPGEELGAVRSHRPQSW